ncbi:protein amnionless [Anopheles aquasalis]|uniref:protein amnionless n=1 Tax=Anopheles aquasalis TaxID=42839 RepID=UPI00215A9F8F|nr:protein amnionless [Anopheles aquasalis]
MAIGGIVLVVLKVLATFLPTDGTKVWLPTVDITQGVNWEAGHFPSSGDAIVFPTKLNGLIALPPSLLSVSQLVLPQNGALLLPEDSFILSLVSQQAGKTSSRSVFKTPHRTPYYLGRNWATYDDSGKLDGAARINEAVPHMERVPCQYETALFPVGPPVSRIGTPQPIDVQYHESIEVGNMKIGADDGIEGIGSFQSFLNTELGQYLFYNADDTIVREGKCSNAEKCPCQEEHQRDAICSNELPCPLPHCLSPVQPAGHCCPMCGSVFRMDIAKFRGTFELQAFIDKLRRKLTSGELDDSAIDYHVGVDRSGGGNVVQVVFVDRGEYGEKSLHLMDSLRPFFEKQFTTGYQILHAGQPHVPLDGGQVFGFVFLTLLATTVFFSMFYVYYYDETLVPRLRAVIRTQGFFTTPFVFARFDPHGEADGISVNVNFQPEGGVDPVPEHRSSIETDMLTVAEACSFDNPMYGSTSKVDTGKEAYQEVELRVK